MPDCKSHHPREIFRAAADGEHVWLLLTDSADDDMLIGELEDVKVDLLFHHELEELPEGWRLVDITEDLRTELRNDPAIAQTNRQGMVLWGTRLVELDDTVSFCLGC